MSPKEKELLEEHQGEPPSEDRSATEEGLGIGDQKKVKRPKTPGGARVPSPPLSPPAPLHILTYRIPECAILSGCGWGGGAGGGCQAKHCGSKILPA